MAINAAQVREQPKMSIWRNLGGLLAFVILLIYAAFPREFRD